MALANVVLIALAVSGPLIGQEGATDEHPVDLSSVERVLERAASALGAGDAAAARADLAAALETLEAIPLDEQSGEAFELLWRAGVLAWNVGHLEGAREAFARIVSHRERLHPPDDPSLLRAKTILATALASSGDLHGARGLEEEILANYERTRPDDDPDLLRARSNLAATLYELRDFAGARPLQEATLDGFVRTLGEEHPMSLSARENLALTLKSLGDLQGALALEDGLLSSAERAYRPGDPSLARIRGNVALTMRALGDLDGALRLQERALADLGEALPDENPMVLRLRLNLSTTLLKLGELDRARDLQESILAACEQTLPAGHPDILGVRAKLGATLFELGQLPEALELQESVLAGYERDVAGDHPLAIGARLDLADTVKALGDLSRARALQESALAVLERAGNDEARRLPAYANLGLTLRAIGDLVAARAMTERALAGYERTLPSEHVDLFRTRINLSGILVDLGERDAARRLLEAGLAGIEQSRSGDDPDLLRARGILAGLLKRMRQHAAARELEESVLEGFERTLPPGHPNLLGARENLAITLRNIGEVDRARALLAEVLAIRERTLPEDHPDLLGSRQNLALILLEQGETEEAHRLGRDLARGVRRQLEIAWALSPREAREIARWESHRHRIVRYLTRGASADGLAEARFDLAETLRAVSNMAGCRLVASSQSERVAAQRARLSDLVAGGPRGGETLGEYAAEIFEVVRERDMLEREVRDDRVASGVFAGSVESDDVARALPDGSVAVGFLRHHAWREFRSVGEVMAAHVLRPDGSLIEVDLGSAARIEELAELWREAAGEPMVSRGLGVGHPGAPQPDLNEAGRRLRAYVLDPVLNLLEEGTTLYVCLDDFLHVVPLDALPLDRPPEGGRLVRVGDRHRIVIEVSFARLVVSSRRSEPEPALLVLGDAAFDGTGLHSPDGESSAPVDHGTRSAGAQTKFAPLAETRAEANAVGALFEEAFERRPLVLLGEYATKAGFHAQAPGKSYLHVATHGWFAPDSVPSTLDADSERESDPWNALDPRATATGFAPMTLCGLAFSGANRGRDSQGRVPGILTAEELAGVDLSACELAVLSACETGVGIRRAGQGVQSLQAALHAAGVRTAITSLWKVDDAMTRRLMELFYAKLWLEGVPKVEALWQAKRALRDEGAELRDWAGWVLSGDPL